MQAGDRGSTRVRQPAVIHVVPEPETMINGVHAIVYAADPQKARTFFQDVLGLPHVDVGRGWLIFGLPPAEIAAHPADGESGRHELYLMCDDLDATVAELKGKGVRFTTDVSDQPWGRLITLEIPGGGEIGLYQPRHARPPQVK